MSLKTTGGTQPEYKYISGATTFYCHYYSGECEDEYQLWHIKKGDKIVSLKTPFKEWIKDKRFKTSYSTSDKEDALDCIAYQMIHASKKLEFYQMLNDHYLEIMSGDNPKRLPKDQDLMTTIKKMKQNLSDIAPQIRIMYFDEFKGEWVIAFQEDSVSFDSFYPFKQFLMSYDKEKACIVVQDYIGGDAYQQFVKIELLNEYGQRWWNGRIDSVLAALKAHQSKSKSYD